MLIYEGVYKSYRNDWIKKYALAFVIGYFSLSISYNGSRGNPGPFAATVSNAGTHFLESRAGRSVIIPEFQRRSGNEAVVAATSFS